MPMDIHLHTESVVNERTGETNAPSEYVANLRELERSIQRLDVDIDTAKVELKGLRDEREEAIAALRSAIREGKVLPLLEAGVDDEADED